MISDDKKKQDFLELMDYLRWSFELDPELMDSQGGAVIFSGTLTELNLFREKLIQAGLRGEIHSLDPSNPFLLVNFYNLENTTTLGSLYQGDLIYQRC